jgi:hypothetical protein
MRVPLRFLRAACDFFVGDDWITAAGVIVAITVTALLATAGVRAWWLPPVAVLLLLGRSLRRATRRGP